MRNEIIVFSVLSIFIVYFSKHILLKFKSHGFYRFVGWECIAWLFANNYKYWFVNSFSWNQIISWLLLIYSVYLVVAGVILLKNLGKADQTRIDNSLYKFERTTELVEAGIYKYIRHPLYGSLIFLSWGIYFKNTASIIMLVIAIISSILFFITASFDEMECLTYFGDRYRDYMKRTSMFIPFIF